MSLWGDRRTEGIIKTLREKGLSDLQINNAFVVLESGGSVREAEDAIAKLPSPIRANFESELLLRQLEKELQLAELKENVDVYPDGTKAWPSNY